MRMSTLNRGKGNYFSSIHLLVNTLMILYITDIAVVKFHGYFSCYYYRKYTFNAFELYLAENTQLSLRDCLKYRERKKIRTFFEPRNMKDK